MVIFENLFRGSKGLPVAYNGRLLHLCDFVPCTQGDVFRITFEATSSKWRQGVMVQVEGALAVAGDVHSEPIVLWEDTAPTEIEILVVAAKGPLQVRNVWDAGDGVTHSWHNGAAMIIEKIPGGRRYRCNDGYPDDDFDDIVFLLKRQS